MSTDEKRLLLVARSFPPHSGGATQRSLKFAKFLPRHGWQVTVLTPQAELCREAFGIEDRTLLAEIPPEVEVLRTFSDELERSPPRRVGVPGLDALRREIWRFRLGPDRGTLWHKSALPAALARAKETSFTAVFATAPSNSNLLLGRRLARTLRVPLVADFRDPWCRRGWPPGWRAGPRARRWERTVLRTAAAAVFVTPAMVELYARAYPELASRFHLIENGVDLEEPERAEPARPSRDRFELVYTGLFYSVSSPESFLRALALARERSEAFRARARFVLAGSFGVTEKFACPVRELIAELDLAGAVEERGYLPHAEATRLQRTAGALVLVVQSPVAPASKSYAYLAAGRPILALAPRPGEAERVLSRGVMTVLADPNNPEDAAGKLLDLFGRWERGELFDLPAPEVPAEFTRAYQAKQLVDILDAVTGDA